MSRRWNISAVIAVLVVILLITWLVNASTSRGTADGSLGTRWSPLSLEVPSWSGASLPQSTTRTGPVSAAGVSDPNSSETDISTAMESGIASFVAPAFGNSYLALPEGPGVGVRICAAALCVVRTSTDAGPDLAMQRAGRVVDLSFRDFGFLCQCEPYSVGLVEVNLERLGHVTQPPTDTEP